MTRTLLAALLLLGSLSAALPQAGYPVGPLPSATGQATTGQIPGTTTNDNATAGNVGEIIASPGATSTGTVTISNASPAVITDSRTCQANATSSCIGIGNVVHFTTTGGLPTGLSTGTNYYVLSAGFTAGTSYQVATSPFGTAINTSSAGSGTQTADNSTIGCGNNANCTIAAVSLTAGDWRCQGWTDQIATGTVTAVKSFIGTTHNSSTGQIINSTSYENVSISADEIIRPTGYVRILLSGTTTYYLLGLLTFSTGSVSSAGSLVCTRVR